MDFRAEGEKSAAVTPQPRIARWTALRPLPHPASSIAAPEGKLISDSAMQRALDGMTLVELGMLWSTRYSRSHMSI